MYWVSHVLDAGLRSAAVRQRASSNNLWRQHQLVSLVTGHGLGYDSSYLPVFRVAPAEAVSLNDVSEAGFVGEEERW